MYHVPTLVLDGRKLILGNHSPNKIRDGSTCGLVEQKLELKAILRAVCQIILAPCKMEDELEEIMTRLHDKSCVEGLDSPSSSREVELHVRLVCRIDLQPAGPHEIGVAICNELRLLRGLRELLIEDRSNVFKPTYLRY
jgi:hypothetical protein